MARKNNQSLASMDADGALVVGDDHAGGDRVIVASNPTPSCESETSFGDSHYPIAEEFLERARASHEGENSWMKDGHLKFTAGFGQVIELEGASSDDEDPGDGKHCQAQYCPGVCKADLPDRYEDLMEQIKNLLRAQRQERRDSGFVANHVPLLVHYDGDYSAIDEFFLMTRTSFSPFDGTLMEMELVSDALARIRTRSGFPCLHPLPRVLYELSKKKDLKLSTCRYRATALSTISLDGKRPIFDPIQDGDEDAADDGVSEDSGAEVGQMSLLLRKALGKTKRRKNTSKTATGKSRAKAKAKTAKANVVKAKTDPIADREGGGQASSASDEVMKEWANAWETQQGAVPDICAPKSKTSVIEIHKRDSYC